jgi:hypothetical protein
VAGPGRADRNAAIGARPDGGQPGGARRR